MLAGFARQFKSLSLPTAGCSLGLAALLLLAGAGSVHDATATNETRTLSFHHTHSNEDLTVTFKRNGRYDEAALKELNHYLRDWRTQDQTVMDPHLFDIIWEVYRDVGGQKPIQIISSYRSPATNAMLHRRSSGVARFSQHMLGHAMDLFIPGVPLEQIRFAGLRLQRGGVGFYPSSGSPFVHLDTGSIRHWPGMTHDQLARVFPDERTVHMASDGRPMKGYQLARADIEARDGNDNAMKKSSPSLWAALFKRKSSDDDDDEAVTAPVPTPQQLADAAAAVSAANRAADAKAGLKSAPAVKPADIRTAAAGPRAKSRFTSAIQLASADSQIAKPSPPIAVEAADKAQTPADIINARGLWGNDNAAPQQASPAQIAALRARQALAAADPHPTASVSALQALAYAPAPNSPADRADIVASSAPTTRGSRPAPNPDSVTTGFDTAPTHGAIMIATRLAAAKDNGLWLRVMMLAPSASHSMFTTVLGDTDMTLMRAYFAKPRSVVAMSFSDDPQMGLVSDHFTGSISTRLSTTSLAMHTASLR